MFTHQRTSEWVARILVGSRPRVAARLRGTDYMWVKFIIRVTNGGKSAHGRQE